MNTPRLIRIGAITIVALLAIGLLGNALNNSGSDSTTLTIGTDAAMPEGVSDGDLAALNLGRDAIAVPPMAPSPILNSASDLPYATKGEAGASSQRSAAPSAGGVVTDPGSPPDAFASNLDDRKIVQTASIKMQVEGVGESFEEASRIATAAGGFVASSNFTFQGEDQIASLTIRVPTANYQSTLSELRRLGKKIDTEGSNASDVTEEYTDLTARLRNLEASETRFLELLGRANNVSEILQVQDRINNVRSDIERTKGRMQLLDKLTDLATISIHLRPVVAGGNSGPNDRVDFGAEISEAWDASIDFLSDIAAGVLTVIVFAWWLPIVAVPTYLVVGRRLRNNPPSLTTVD